MIAVIQLRCPVYIGEPSTVLTVTHSIPSANASAIVTRQKNEAARNAEPVQAPQNDDQFGTAQLDVRTHFAYI